MTEKPKIGSIDQALLRKCLGTVVIPDRELTQADVEKYWGTDRTRLVACSKKHQGLVKAIEFRDKAINE